MPNGNDWFDFDDLDFLGLSESEVEDMRTNKEDQKTDVSPDALEKEDLFKEDNDGQ